MCDYLNPPAVIGPIPKSPAEAVKTAPVPEKKPVKSASRKSTATKPGSKKTVPSKVNTKALPKKAKVESAKKPVAKSKTVQSKVSAVKKEPVKSTTTKPAVLDKNSPAKSPKTTKIPTSPDITIH